MRDAKLAQQTDDALRGHLMDAELSLQNREYWRVYSEAKLCMEMAKDVAEIDDMRKVGMVKHETVDLE